MMILSGNTLENKGLIMLVDDEDIVLDVGTQMIEGALFSLTLVSSSSPSTTWLKN